MNTKTTALLATLTASAAAYDISTVQKKQLDIILGDVGKFLIDYANGLGSFIDADTIPPALMSVGAELSSDPNGDYSAEYSSIPMAYISSFVTKLPWYSSRIKPALEAAGVPVEQQVTSTKATTTKAAAATTTKAAAATTTKAAAETTAKAAAETTPATDAAAETTAKAAAATTTKAAAETTAKAAAETTPATDAAVVETQITSVPGVGVETKYITSTRVYSNTTTITSCPPESSTVDITAQETSTVIETVCDEVCHSKKAAAAAASATTVTAEQTSTVTATVCDEVCHSKKSAAAAASSTSTTAETKKTSSAPATEKASTTTTKAQTVTPSTVAQVTKSETSTTSSKPVIEQQTENGAAKTFAGLGAGVLAAVALLI